MSRIVLLWGVIAVQVVVCIEVVVFAGVVGIGVVLVEHGVGTIRGVVLLFCIHELTLGRQSSTAFGLGEGPTCRADQCAFGKDWGNTQMLMLQNRQCRWRHCLSSLAGADRLIGCCLEAWANHAHQPGTGQVVELVEDAMLAEADTSRD